MNDTKALIFKVGIASIIYAMIMMTVFIVAVKKEDPNSKQHGEDIRVTEWISPDGVHYWYRGTTQSTMLAPRYDEKGMLVIDK